MQMSSLVFVVAIFGTICLPTIVNCGVVLKDVKDNPNLLHKAILDEHNRLRNREAIDEKASFMYQMALNQSLIDFAQTHVDNCEYEHTETSDRKNKYGFDYFGENLFITTGEDETIASVVQDWYNEKQYYTYSDKSCSAPPGKGCGHYTQVVWDESKYLGCGLKFCSTIDVDGQTWNDAYLVSCNYGPGGNMNNEHPYEIGNKACEKCQNNCVDSGLCAADYTVEICKDEFNNCPDMKEYCNDPNNPQIGKGCCKTCKGTKDTNTVEVCKDEYDNCPAMKEFCNDPDNPQIGKGCCKTCKDTGGDVSFFGNLSVTLFFGKTGQSILACYVCAWSHGSIHPLIEECCKTCTVQGIPKEILEITSESYKHYNGKNV